MLGSKIVKFLVETLNSQFNSFSNFASFFIAITHNTLVNFKLQHFLFCMEGINKSPNFETSVYCGYNFTNSSSHFPNHKSLFLQIIHHSLTSWNITHLYFSTSNIIYFSQKQPIKVQIFENFQCSNKYLSNCLRQF